MPTWNARREPPPPDFTAVQAGAEAAEGQVAHAGAARDIAADTAQRAAADLAAVRRASKDGIAATDT